MSDHPHEEAIKLLYAASEDYPAAAVVLGDRGPRMNVSTGHTDDPIESQLIMIAAYINWMAEHTDVEPETVADDALAIVRQMRDDEDTLTFEWDSEGLSGE